MPLIAREVVIKVTVEDSAGKSEEKQAEGGNGTAGDKDVISACVERVLEILKEKSEP